MDLDEFRASLSGAAPPTGLGNALQALWCDAHGDWDRAHELSNDAGAEGDWVHAYLHRKEGDISNADYWYRRVGRERPEVSLEEEWETITRELLAGSD